MGDTGVSVIVGGGQGIGESLARGLAARGDRVVVASRNAEALRAVADSLNATGADAEIAIVDISAPSDIRRFAEEVVASHGIPRVLVNAAGNSVVKPAFDVTMEEWDLIHDVHLRGAFFLNVAVARFMMEDGYGKIVNLSSTWAETVSPGRSVYAAAKAGLSQLTTALAVEWAPLGIRVNAVAPGATVTPRTKERFQADHDRLQTVTQRIPLGRIGQPEDVVGAVEFLTSKASDFITGQTLFVDGGFLSAR